MVDVAIYGVLFAGAVCGIMWLIDYVRAHKKSPNH